MKLSQVNTLLSKNNKIFLVSGHKYKLRGEINEERMKNQGFSHDLINLFKYGFPENWKTILKDLIKNISSLIIYYNIK